ncbi:unnamed protein product [Pocillopora meandrina]|uniref:Uncharacterized protein n=1 Tax=Pocillopora meandrina TaxID=46732 RepID=A0AAU9WDJ6_9CNID|nr:unnamed protein product [Pocillopora meandrina]
MTGAVVKSKGHDSRVYVSGSERNAKHAEYVIKSRMAAARIGDNSVCVCIDDKYLPEDCELQLVEEMEHSILSLGSSSQYRLKPCEEYDMDAKGTDALDQAVAKCDDCIEKRVLTSLRSLKMKIESGNYQKADLWCHFGKIVIREPDEADLEETWSIDNSIKKFQRTEENKNAWRATFKEGVNLADKVVSDTFPYQIGEDFMARHDLTFLSPKSQTMRFKVWVANKDVGKKLEEIPIPFDDLKNVVEELRFEDESTRARCRGWLVLHSKKFLDVNIIFPGSDVDCRINLRAVMGDLVAKNNLNCEEEETHLISNYLSKVTFSDADGLRLPEDEKLPQGFNFVHQRCSRRTLFTPRPGFTMIVSNERSWYSNLRDEENKVTTDIHLHCEKWDQLLNEEDWEPETICAELPEFLHFVRQVQDFISCKSNKTADQK